MTDEHSGELDFEKALGELESLVELLERGELSLDDSLQRFERGIALTRRCQDALKAAEQRVQKLVEGDGEARVVDLDTQG